MAYVQAGDEYRDASLDGFFDALKKAGGFVVKKVVPKALPFVPGIGPVAAAAYSQIPGIAPGAPAPTVTAPRRTGIAAAARRATREPWWKAAARRAAEAAAADPGFRERAVRYTSRLPPQLLAAAAARRAGEIRPAVKAGLTTAALLPILGIAAFAFRRR